MRSHVIMLYRTTVTISKEEGVNSWGKVRIIWQSTWVWLHIPEIRSFQMMSSGSFLVEGPIFI
jgi:hypothetical protein